MKLALIGLGQAGGKIVDSFLAYEQRTGVEFAPASLAINTAKADLTGLDRIPRAKRKLIGQARVNGHGVGADNELAAEIAEENIEQLQRAFDDIPVHEIDAFLLVAALGGGTGSGMGPVLARHLKRLYTEPVYALGVLPGANEGGIYSLNAARALRTYVRETDNLLVFDNDAWRQSGESIRRGYEEINREIARRFGVLFSAGEIDGAAQIAESVVDSSEVINTLAGGGVSTVGYATETTSAATSTRGSGMLDRLQNRVPFGGSDRTDGDAVDATATTNRITSVIRKATLGRLTLPCDPEGAERALVVVAGPPAQLNRKGVEQARTWIESETGSREVRGGDYPLTDEDGVAGLVLLSGVSNVPRIETLKQVAVDAKDTKAEQTDGVGVDSDPGELLSDDDLDPLF